MKVRRIISALIAAGSLVVMAATPTISSADAGLHVMYVNGISTVQNQCEYVWAKDALGQPIRDDLGIPKPTTLPPTCRRVGGNTVSCSLKRNLGHYPPPERPADVTKAEVGLNPPCSGNLTADGLPGLQGCVDVSTTGPNCDVNAPTWFYGYCAQTYGGAEGGSFKLGADTWEIERMGFARGRGIWEFSGRMHKAGETANKASFRMYLDAVPNKPQELAACDGGPTITSVEFFGSFITPAPPAKVIRTNVGWHWCDDDQPVKAGTPGENC